MGAATASFYRADSSLAGLREYVVEHDASDVAQIVLRSREERTEPPEIRAVWPRSLTVYERYLYLPNQFVPNVLQEARHYLQEARYRVLEARQLRENDRHAEYEIVREKAVAAAYAAIRKTHVGLAESPNDKIAYHFLGESYDYLHEFERSVEQPGERAATEQLRDFQAIAAHHHVLSCDPQDPVAHYRLFRAFQRRQRPDLTLYHLQRLQQITGQFTLFPPTDPRFEADQQRNNELFLTLSQEQDELTQSLEEQLSAGGDRVQLVEQLVVSGYYKTALETLEADLTVVSGNARVSFLHGLLLLHVGRTEEAYNQLQDLKSLPDLEAVPHWRTIYSLSQLAAEDLLGAAATTEEQLNQLELSATVLMIQSGQLLATGPTGRADDDHQTDPLLTVSRRTTTSGAYFGEIVPRIEDTLLRQALIRLELGDNQASEELFRELLLRDPATSLRPLAVWYLSLLTDGADIPPGPTGEASDEVVPDLFDEESGDDDSTKAPVEEAESSEDDTSEEPKREEVPSDADSSSS